MCGCCCCSSMSLLLLLLLLLTISGQCHSASSTPQHQRSYTQYATGYQQQPHATLPKINDNIKYSILHPPENNPQLQPTNDSPQNSASRLNAAPGLFPNPEDNNALPPRPTSHDTGFVWKGRETRVRLTTTRSSDEEGDKRFITDRKNDEDKVPLSRRRVPAEKKNSAWYEYISGYPYDDVAERRREGEVQWGIEGRPRLWGSSTGEAVLQITDRALLEEADADATGQTHCLDIPRCSYLPVRKECRGHERQRTADGTCNNLHQPMWGSAFQPFQRYLPPSYQDGVESPRALSSHVDNQGRQLPLPSPRLVSRTVHLVQDMASTWSSLLMQFGQFVDHDITGTSSTVGKSGAIICCGKNPQQHKDCMPISVPPGDTHFTDTTCINFVRSLPYSDPRNNVQAPREQRNEVTSFLDGSVVYGSSEDQTARLRSFQNGMLKYSGGQMLPLEQGGCVSPDGLCLLSGDTRVNELPGLGSLHVLFHRHHNRLATQLLSLLGEGGQGEGEGQVNGRRQGLRPTAVDEAVFQTARKILAAQLQHITYTEWLPLVLGPFAVEHYGLNPNATYKYDSGRDPRIANVFATAAFRFGHSLVPDWFLFGEEMVSVHKAFNNPSWVRRDVDKVVRGLLQAPAQARDQFFTDSIRNRLFEVVPRGGLDLVSLNLQRGRDHGLPPYLRWRGVCGLPHVHGFNDTALGTAGPALREVYLTVEDIDLFTGAVAEPALTGGLMGPTLACLIGRQFADLKFADRFFYQTTGPEGFTPNQLDFIYQTTMAGLICANTHNVTSVQRNPFKAPSERNPLVACPGHLKETASVDAWTLELTNHIDRLSLPPPR